MDYLDWNNEIASYFFKEENAEKEVYLLITKQQIIEIGKKCDLQGSNEEVFLDYINAVKAVKFPTMPSQQLNPIDAAVIYHLLWRKCPEEFPFPPFIGYLVLFIIPLFEKSLKKYRQNNFYDRVNDFFRKYSILDPDKKVTIKTTNFMQIDALWNSLEQWSIDQKNTELGYFEMHPFKNKNWVHVGKPLSQCIFSEKAIRNLNKFYEAAGIVPNEGFGLERCRDLILDYGAEHLFLDDEVLNLISDKNNELGVSIIKLVIRNYKEWKGDTDTYDQESETIKKGYTLARLKLCCQYDPINGITRFYYRLYSRIDYPDDLTFEYNGNTYRCFVQRRGWSNPINAPFSDELLLEDSTNKWKAKLPPKNVRILIAGIGFHLNDWIEIEHMLVTSTMLLLVKTEIRDSIETWGNLFEEGKFKRIELNGLPENYHLYECKNPDIEHPDIPMLSYKTEKRFIWNDGLKIFPRTYLPSYLPNIEIENGRGDELLVLNYEGNVEKINLIRRDVEQPIWDFPAVSKIILNKKFSLKVLGKTIDGEKLKGKILMYNSTQQSLDKYPVLMHRDIYGNKIDGDGSDNNQIVGFETSGINFLRNDKYMMFFKPVEKYADHDISVDGGKDEDDLLLYFLSVKEKCKSKVFFSTFETIYYERFDNSEIDKHKLDLATIKRWSLEYFKHMGFIDYDYSSQDIIIYPPQVIFVTTNEGRKAIFIGARTPIVCRKFIKSVVSAGYRVSVESQSETLKQFLLPNTISITAKHDQRKSFDSTIMKICNAYSIKFLHDRFPAFELAEFSGELGDYTINLFHDERFNPSGWKTQVFDSNAMRFVNIDSEKIDKDFSLVEYKLNEYTYSHRLWDKGKAYRIDKSWGRYIILNKERRNIITYKRNLNNRMFCDVIVPATIPITELINKALICCSGKSPQRKLISHMGNKMWCNIYKNIPFIFASNYFKKLGQAIKEINN